MHIILIRHGETIWNAARIMQYPDTPLSERGELQAQGVATRLRDEPIAAILASDYLRAQQTAAAVAALAGLPVRSSTLLRERNFGDHRGTAIDTLEVDVFASGYHPPGGESEAEFDARVALAWREMLAAAADLVGDLVVVSHALVVRSVIQRHLDTSAHLAAGTPLRLPNTAVTVFHREPPHTLQTLGCAAHLQGDTLPDARTHPAGI